MLHSLRSFFLHPQSIIIGLGFSTLSLLMSTWAIRLPELKAQLQLSDTQIGTALLVLSIGSLIISPFSSYIMDRYPTGKVTYASVLFQACAYLLPFQAHSYIFFLLAMFAVGLANGFINITLNASAAMVEKKYQRSIMSSCHAMFSIGAIIGSIAAGFISEMGISPTLHMSMLILGLLLLNFLLRKVWASIPNSDLKAPVFAIPSLPVLGYFIIVFCIVLAEMTVMDWSAVYLSDTLHSPAAITGLGFAGFSITMAFGRLSGDMIIPKIGKQRIIIWACLIAAIGLSIAAATSHPWIAILGFTLAGLGMSVTVPLIFSVSANMKTVSPGVGIASIATASVLGGFVGRPMVGFVADTAGMSVSMWIAGGFALIAMLIGIINKRQKAI